MSFACKSQTRAGAFCPEAASHRPSGLNRICPRVVKGLRSEYEQAKQAWKGCESPERQIEKLRGEVSKLDCDVNKVKDELAKEIVVTQRFPQDEQA